MGHSPRDLKVYSKVIVDSKPWLMDPKIIPIPWRPIELPRQLSFAVIKSNNVVNPLPPVSRGLEITIQKLQNAGHEIIEWDLRDQNDTAELSVSGTRNAANKQYKFFTAGGAKPITSLLEESGEPFPDGLRMLYDESMQDIPTTELWKLHLQRSDIAKRYLDTWNDTAQKTKSGRPIDAIIRFISSPLMLIKAL
jgi:amidase